MAPISAKWSRVFSNPRLCRSSQAISVIAKRAFIFGGELHPREPIDNQYDVVNINEEGKWDVQHKDSTTDCYIVASLRTVPATGIAPIPRVGSPGTTANDNIWLFSGRGGIDMKPIDEQGALWRYDTGNQEWTLVKPTDPKAPYPAGRSYHCITSNGNDKIYVHSGCPEAGRLADLWVFDIPTKAWSELPPAPPPARGGASIAYLGNKIYRMNGFDGKVEQGGALDVFDVATGSWSTISHSSDGIAGPTARSVATLLPVVTQGKEYLVTMFGERDPSSLGHAGAGKMLSDAWAFDVLQTQWNQLSITGESPEPRGWFDADVMKDDGEGDVVIVHGGLSEQNQRLGDIWKLTLA